MQQKTRKTIGIWNGPIDEYDFMRQLCTVLPTVEADGCCGLPTGVGLGADMNEAVLCAHPAQPWIPEAFRPDGSIADW